MAKSQETFNKKEKEKLRQKKREDKLKKKTGKKDESKPGSNKDKDSVSAQPEAVDNNGSKTAASRTEVKSNINEPVLSNAFTLGN
jgi:hypothetical protein